MKLFVLPDGRIQHLLNEEEEELLRKVLPPIHSIGRFSNVDTIEGGVDWYIKDLPNSSPIGPFDTRKEALKHEQSLAEQFLRNGSSSRF